MARTVLPAAPPKTGSLLIRLSKLADDKNLSKDGMRDDMEKLAADEGIRVVAIHTDDGFSGAIRDRPGFLAWLEDARQLRADTLITWHVDRMTREGVNVAGVILDVIEGKDPKTGQPVRQPVRLLDTQGLDSSGDETSFRFNFVIKAEVARAERERMKLRMKAANRRVRSAGRWPGGPAPYGFVVIDNPDGPGKVIIPEPAEAAFILEAAERILAGQPITTVTRWANRQTTMRPRKSASWDRKSLAHVLTGFPVQGKVMQEVGDKWLPVLDERDRPVTHERILEPDTSAAVRQALAVKDPTPSKGGRAPSRLLSGGLLRCASCSGSMTVSTRRKPYAHISYRCVDGYANGRCRRPVSVTAHLIEAFIERAFLQAHGDQPEMVKRAHVAGAAVVEAAEERHATALQAISVAPTAENFAALQAAVADLEEARSLPHETTLTFIPTGRTIAEAWQAGALEDRRELLATNYVEVRVRPGERGKRSIEPERVDIVAQPLYVAGASLEEDYAPGMLVIAEDDD